MKKILVLIAVLLAMSCTKDDGLGTLVITIDEVTDHTAKISWSISGAESAVFEITLNGNVLSNGTGSTQYTFTNLNQLQEYSGVVFARTPDGGETFSHFSFRTVEDRYDEGNMWIFEQAAMDNFNFTTIEGALVIIGADITDLTNLSTLTEVGSIFIKRTSLINLNGLHNVEQFTEGEGTILFAQNPDLKDVSALSNLSGSINCLYIESNPSLLDLTPLSIAEGGCLFIEKSPINNLTQLSFGDYLGSIELKSLPNFNGLNGLKDLSRLGLLKMMDVPNLTEVNTLSQLTELHKIEFHRLAQLTDLTGLSNINISERIRLDNLPSLSSLNGLQATTHLNELNLNRLPKLTSLNGLNNLTEIGLELQQFDEFYRAFSLRTLNITSLEGLDNLTKARDINIWDCNSLLNLDGAQLTGNGDLDFARWLVLIRNTNLSDFCGLTDFVTNSDFDVFQVQNNQYNPLESQIGSASECSL